MTTRDEFRQAIEDEYRHRIGAGASMFDVAADVAERLGMTSEHPGPWEPGQDVTARLRAGETAPEGTILRNRNGLIWRTEEDGNGTLWIKFDRRWSSRIGAWSWTDDETKFGAGTGPIFVAAPKVLS